MSTRPEFLRAHIKGSQKLSHAIAGDSANEQMNPFIAALLRGSLEPEPAAVAGICQADATAQVSPSQDVDAHNISSQASKADAHMIQVDQGASAAAHMHSDQKEYIDLPLWALPAHASEDASAAVNALPVQSLKPLARTSLAERMQRHQKT